MPKGCGRVSAHDRKVLIASQSDSISAATIGAFYGAKAGASSGVSSFCDLLHFGAELSQGIRVLLQLFAFGFGEAQGEQGGAEERRAGKDECAAEAVLDS